MSELTKETREEAGKLRIFCTETKTTTYSVNGTSIKDLISFLEPFKDKEDIHIHFNHDEYFGDRSIEISEQVPLSEEAVRKLINRFLDHQKVLAKHNKLAKMSGEERLRLEIKELEKKLARKKKKLGSE